VLTLTNYSVQTFRLRFVYKQSATPTRHFMNLDAVENFDLNFERFLITSK